jgi:tetratricopeptide (TPR) repeat protein
VKASNPWMGVRPFGPQDGRKFFGRTGEIRRLADLWREHRVTVLHGDSGTGKTSLIQAGLIRNLTEAGANVLPLGNATFRTEIPAPSAAGAGNPYTVALLASWQADEPGSRSSGPAAGSWLSDPTIAAFLRGHERRDRLNRPVPTLLAIDRLPQIVAEAPKDAARGQFVTELTSAFAATPGAHLLLSIRSCELDLMKPVVAAVAGDAEVAMFRLDPLTRSAAVDAISLPADEAGLRFERGAAGRLVDEIAAVLPADAPATVPPDNAQAAVRPEDARAPEGPVGVEPVLLQIVASALWEALGERETVIATDMMPDVELVLADYCAETLGRITSDNDLPTCEVGTWLRKAFVTAGGAPTGVPDEARPAEMTDSVMRALEDGYLVKPVMLDGRTHFVLRFARLAGALGRIREANPPVRRIDPREALADAEQAWLIDDLVQARRHALAAARATGSTDLRSQARAEALLGDIAYRRGRSDAAERHYRTAAAGFERLQDAVEAGRMLAAVGRLKLADGDQAGAADELQNAAQRAPNDPYVLVGLSLVCLARGRVETAMSLLKDALRERTIVEARRIRGEIHADLGEAEAALLDLEGIDLRAEPAARAARALALTMISEGRVPPADLNEIVAAAPQSGPVLLRAARIRAYCGDHASAAELAARAVSAAAPPLPQHQLKEALSLLSTP